MPSGGEAAPCLRRLRAGRRLAGCGADGQWATAALTGADLAAPSLFSYEAANIIRQHERTALVTADQAAQAHADLRALAVEQWPYVLLVPRTWDLRKNLTTYEVA